MFKRQKEVCALKYRIVYPLPGQFGFPSKIPIHATLVVAGRKTGSVYTPHVCSKKYLCSSLIQKQKSTMMFQQFICNGRKPPSELGDLDTPTLYKIRPKFYGFIVIFLMLFPILSTIDTMNYIILEIYFISDYVFDAISIISLNITSTYVESLKVTDISIGIMKKATHKLF